MIRKANETRHPSTWETSGPTTSKRDGELQRIVNEAASISKMTFAILSAVDQDRRWVASASGMVLTDRQAIDFSLPGLIIRPGEILIISDVLADTRYRHGQASSPTFRSFIGLPMVDLGGYLIGSLRLAGSAPLGKKVHIDALATLAREAERIITR